MEFTKLNGYGVKDATARESVENINSEINIINSEKTLVIGDSYAVGVTNTTVSSDGWGKVLKSINNISDNDYYEYSERGSGFLKEGSTAQNTFITLLQTAINEISSENKNLITKIICCGGYNDRNETYESLIVAIENFINLCKNNFPNAKIYIGMISYSTSTDKSVRVTLANTVLPAYKYCNNYGAIYLNGVENILKNHSLMSNDTTHPLQEGYNEIARGIYQCINNGSYSYLTKLLSSTITDIYEYGISGINANSIRSRIDGNNNLLCIADCKMVINPTEFTLNKINLFKIDVSTMLPCTSYSLGKLKVRFIYDDNNVTKYYENICDVYLEYDENNNCILQLGIYAMSEDKTGYLTLSNVKRLDFTPTILNIDNIYC